jgi:nicotinamide-nucleotide amidase
VDVKASVLGVSEDRLAEYGPVDRVVAQEMAAGARRVCGADIGISSELGERGLLLDLPGDRARIRQGSVDAALAQAQIEVERIVASRRDA